MNTTTTSYEYPINIDVSYNTTREYRQCIRNVFKMNIMQHPIVSINEDEPLDEETLDELNYDEVAARNAMDVIYKLTYKDMVFRKLYTYAAIRMFSTDLETGLSVLMSYDYLSMFHKCLVCFLTTPTKFTRNSEYYKELFKRIR